jgi:hypothetical protein
MAYTDISAGRITLTILLSAWCFLNAASSLVSYVSVPLESDSNGYSLRSGGVGDFSDLRVSGRFGLRVPVW